MYESSYEGARRISDDAQREWEVQYIPENSDEWVTFHKGHNLGIASMIHQNLSHRFKTRLLVDGQRIA